MVAKRTEIDVHFKPIGAILTPHAPWGRGSQVVYDDGAPWTIADTLNVDAQVLFDVDEGGGVARIELLYTDARGPMPRPKAKAGQRMYLNMENRKAVEQTVLVSLQEAGSDLLVNFSDAPPHAEFEIGIDLYARMSGSLLTGLRYKGLLDAT